MSVCKDMGYRAVSRRLRPALCFIAAIIVLAGLALGTGYGAPPPVEQRYARAKAEIEALKSDAKRAGFRSHWIELIKEFDDIYKLDPKWSNRPAAMFQAASAAEELARRSHARNDYKDAAERFENLALKHSGSRLADDALYRAALIRGKSLNDKKAALALLKRVKTQYPKGDMRAKALALEDQLEGKGKDEDAPAPRAEKPAASKQSSKAARSAAGAELSQISWNTLDKKRVQLIVEFDQPVAYKISMQEGNAAKRVPARLIIDAGNTRVTPQMKAGARVSGSLLTRVGVDALAGGHARLTFDFSKLGKYAAKVEQKPFRLIITVFSEGTMPKNQRMQSYSLPDDEVEVAEKSRPERAGGKKSAARSAGKSGPGKAAADKKSAAAAPDSRKDNAAARAVKVATDDLAEQLGLTVQTVLIDPGHGGRDPGTIHNNIVERDIVLDIAKRVGRLLADNGLTVEFSRKTDSYLALTNRTRMAADKRVDLFLSIHVNAHKDVNSEGFETYYLDLANSPQAARVATLENSSSDRKLGDMQSMVSKIMLNAKSSESRRLALDMQRSVVSRIKRSGYNVRDGGVRGAPFHVLVGASMPSVLVEVGYCTNALEAKNLLSAIYRQKLSEGIAEGVLAYRNRLQRRSSAELEQPRKG